MTSKKNLTAKEIYRKLKNGETRYDEEYHCPLIIEVMNNPNKGTISAFCVEAFISDTTFYRWKARHPTFNECYRYAAMMSRENWEDEGRLGKDDESFNMDYWRIIGAARYGVGKSNRVRVEMDDQANPYEQYKQLISQASCGDFTAGELKQLMESINVGTRTYETFELQKEIDRMKEDLHKMEQNNANNSLAIEKAQEIN